jgi:hypothetical protein
MFRHGKTQAASNLALRPTRRDARVCARECCREVRQRDGARNHGARATALPRAAGEHLQQGGLSHTNPSVDDNRLTVVEEAPQARYLVFATEQGDG